MGTITASGSVDAFIVSPDGDSKCVVHGRNTLLFSCADAVANIFGGFSGYRPTVIGFIYGSGEDLGANFNFSAGDRVTRTQDEIVGAGLAVHDQYIDNNRHFEPSAPGYSGNSVTFNAARPGLDSKSYVYGALLKDSSGRVLAVKRFDTPVVQNANYALSLSWTVTFV